MHGHIHGVTAQMPNSYAALALDRALAAQRSAALRRRLLQAASELDTDSSPEALAIAGGWADADPQKRTRKFVPIRLQDDHEAQQTAPVSLWA